MQPRRKPRFKVKNATPPAERLRLRSQRLNSGCVVWTGNRLPFGHGIMTLANKTVKVHRLAWEQAHGPIPDGMAVCHRCDVPSCINVDHLFLGTIADNNADKLSKGRNVSHPGERNGRAILSAEQIAAIRADARKQVDIAREYGIRQGYVSRIKNGRIWRGQDDNEARGAAATPPAARG